MPARFDHLVIAVADLDEAAARWTAAGIPAVRGGAHPVGTVNALVRGPRAAYVELIAAGAPGSNPWLDRVRSGSGPISWAIAVDDVDAAREALVEAGLGPRPVTEGSRLTPDGETVAWRLCDVGAGPYDESLPFLIEWTTPMPPGPADGPVVSYVTLTPPDPDRVADVLLALGFAAVSHWPRRVFRDPDGVGITLLPVEEPGRDGASSWEGPATSLALELPAPQLVHHHLDDVAVMAVPDRRRFGAAALLPAVEAAFARLRGGLADWPNPHPGGEPALEEEYSRCLDPGRYRLLGVRADAWVEAIVSAGLGSATPVPPDAITWVGETHLRPTRATVLRGRDGTLPVAVAWAPMDEADGAFVLVGVGEPAHVLERQPDCGCDACDTGSADLLSTVDDAFLLGLSGGVHVVREGDRVVTRTLNGWSATGVFARGDEDRWLADAAAGRRTDGVVRGEPWV
ncbi:DUF6226 family protein [Nocardioides sp. Soil805]|uniref:DUF6226 family protein n=1 Tax=Nocardioides sp. Soil805 TaxID=1736416 RepID=UPI000703C026|nr:DUF6226 family protein [Nocardioides sp. Soil805]KRF30645.1 hypothetical protein ASG94_19165 [Nocardioides sp. Soil805]